MILNLITFASQLHKQAAVLSSHEMVLNELEKYFTVNLVDYHDIDKLTDNDFQLLFIATGGVELFKERCAPLMKKEYSEFRCAVHTQCHDYPQG